MSRARTITMPLDDGRLENLEIKVGVRNIFNQRASFDAGAQYFASPKGVLMPTTFYISWQKFM